MEIIKFIEEKTESRKGNWFIFSSMKKKTFLCGNGSGGSESGVKK